MKKTIFYTAAAAMFAGAIIAFPSLSRGADDSSATKTPATTTSTATTKFNGSVTAVDTNAMTFTVSNLTFNVTSESRLTKNSKPAVLAEVVVGDPARGSYVKGEDGKLNVTRVTFDKNTGGKASGKSSGKKKKKTNTSGTSTTGTTAISTNAPAATPPK
jgi:hypothetical protein